MHFFAFLFDVVTRLAQALKLAEKKQRAVPPMRDDVIDNRCDCWRTTLQAQLAQWMRR